MSTSIKPPVWFWVVSIFALLWNAGGVFTYLDTAFNQVAMLEEMTQAQRELFENFPAWATGAFAMAVFSGLFASIGLLLRKKWAKPLFILSLLMAVAQFIQWLFVQNAAEKCRKMSIFKHLFAQFVDVENYKRIFVYQVTALVPLSK